jgi:hypothetical protein
MRIAALVLMIVFGYLGQESTANLAETIAWLSNYTSAHAYLYENGTVVQATRLQLVKDCTLKLERRFLKSKGGGSIKRETVLLELSAFNPKVHVRISRTGSPSFQVTFERSDDADKGESDMEIYNGSKVKSSQSNEFIYMDSEESVNRLAKGLSHAIELCGGKPAPF